MAGPARRCAGGGVRVGGCGRAALDGVASGVCLSGCGRGEVDGRVYGKGGRKEGSIQVIEVEGDMRMGGWVEVWGSGCFVDHGVLERRLDCMDWEDDRI